jgi:hypothetical protein
MEDNLVLDYVKRYAEIGGPLETKIKKEGVESNFGRIRGKFYPPSIRFKEYLKLVEGFTTSVIDNAFGEKLRSIGVNVVEDDADYHIMLPGDQSIKVADKYIFSVFDEEYTDLAKLKYDLGSSSIDNIMSKDEWETFYNDYWTIDVINLECERIYVAKRKPDIPESVERRISYLKSLMCSGFRKDLLELQGKPSKVELVAEVNIFLASIVQEWMKEPTLLNWMKIEERFHS